MVILDRISRTSPGVKSILELHAKRGTKSFPTGKELLISLSCSDSNNNHLLISEFFIKIVSVTSIHKIFHFAGDIRKVNGTAKNDNVAGLNEREDLSHIISTAVRTAFGFVAVVVDLCGRTDIFLSQVN